MLLGLPDHENEGIGQLDRRFGLFSTQFRRTVLLKIHSEQGSMVRSAFQSLMVFYLIVFSFSGVRSRRLHLEFGVANSWSGSLAMSYNGGFPIGISRR